MATPPCCQQRKYKTVEQQLLTVVHSDCGCAFSQQSEKSLRILGNIFVVKILLVVGYTIAYVPYVSNIKKLCCSDVIVHFL